MTPDNESIEAAWEHMLKRSIEPHPDFDPDPETLSVIRGAFYTASYATLLRLREYMHEKGPAGLVEFSNDTEAEFQEFAQRLSDTMNPPDNP